MFYTRITCDFPVGITLVQIRLKFGLIPVRVVVCATRETVQRKGHPKRCKEEGVRSDNDDSRRKEVKCLGANSHERVRCHVEGRGWKAGQSSMERDHSLDLIIATERKLDDSRPAETVTNHRNVFMVDIFVLLHFFDRTLDSLHKESLVASIQTRIFQSLVHSEVLLEVCTVNVGSEADCEV